MSCFTKILSIMIILLAILNVAKCEENLTISDTPVQEQQTEQTPSNTTSSETANQEDEDKAEFENFSRKLMEEMGFNQEIEISKEKLTQFLRRLITRDEKLETNEDELYTELIERVVKAAPETIKTSEISQYIDQDILMRYLNDLIREKYGEEALQHFSNEVDVHPDL